VGSSNLGLDPAVVAHQSNVIHNHAAMLDDIAGQIGQTGEASRWPGVFGLIPGNVIMTQGSIFLAQSAEADVRAAAASATEMLSRLSAAIDEQRAASSATDGYVDGKMSAAQAAAIYNEVMTNPSVLEGMSPEQVADWFEHLTPAQQDSFINDQHEIAGTTNGIPFDRRIEANVLNAQDRLASGAKGEEKTYLERVVAGEVKLISYNHDDNRIIEMVGNYYPEDVVVDGVVVHEKTKDIVNYMPGTTADLAGFYSGDTQAIARNLVETSSDGTVAFVFKDAPFPTFEPDGVYNSSWAASVGSRYHDFNTALGLENATSASNPARGGVPVTSIEHSFATAAGGYAEMQGTEYDNRIVLGGIGMPDGWKPNSGTDYYSIAGQDDIIRVARGLGSDDFDLGYPVAPTEENGFTQLDPKFGSALTRGTEEHDIPVGDMDSPESVLGPIFDKVNTPWEYVEERVEQHSRVAGTEDNPDTLNYIKEILSEQ